MKQKIIFFFTCFFIYLLLFVLENALFSFAFTLLQIKGAVLPILTIFLLIIVNPPITWILSNKYYPKIVKDKSSLN
ncbi:hypothetical protein SAMN02745191_2309 [Anaerorhabdus furcosa]|uniref:Uncharacterized protein n=1 Tax=Anaerorhabdus furcosa TaxID=118967 RepID=A0A1T4Q499_9FIRM|nr:hypothetical protein SAMN02745191_2309 [Anaerorhabdus furcosa]